MKKLLCLFSLCVALINATSRDITISDNHIGNGVGSWVPFGGPASSVDGRPGVYEDNEVEPLNNAHQKWDYEGFIQNNHRLSIVAGFDFKNGAEIPHDGWFYPGDIFIGQNMIRSPSFVTTGYHNYLNDGASGSWQYVIHFNDGPDGNLHGIQDGDTYEVRALNRFSVLESVYYRSNRDSNPFRYVSGGDLITTGQIHIQNNISDADLPFVIGSSFVGGWHNILTVDLSWLDQSTIVGPSYLNTTISCGNDDLRGILAGFEPVPDNGSSLVALAFGFGAIVAVRRKQ